MHPKQNKITEKQFLRALVASVCGIVLCLTGLVGTTWAWYTLTISSEDNTIQVGSFAAEAMVTANDSGDTIPASGQLTYELPAGEYTVRISSSGANTIPGYCVVKFADKTYETARLYPAGSGDGKPSAIEFTVKVGEPAQQTDPEGEGTGEQQTRVIYTAQLQIVPMWGDPSGTGELLGETVSEITNGVETAPDPESDTSDDTDDSNADDSNADDSNADDSTTDDSTPSESTPSESTPSESTPGESTPSESTPGESIPSESTPGESTPGESTPSESTPGESTPSESTPSESTPGESTPSESTPDESTTDDSTSTESTPSDSNAQSSENEQTTQTKDAENTPEG